MCRKQGANFSIQLIISILEERAFYVRRETDAIAAGRPAAARSGVDCARQALAGPMQ